MLEESMGLFTLGVATFLSPCSIALISVYLTYAAGVSKSVRKGLAIGCSFAVAMCVVFFLIGYALSSLIPLELLDYRLFLGISGVLLLFFGLNNSGVIKKAGVTASIGSSLSERIKVARLNALTRFSTYNYMIGSFLFGVVISLALGPCSLGLVLPAILLTLFSAPTSLHGGFLLFMFGLGHALPVVFLSVIFATARKLATDKISRAGEYLTVVFGIVFIVIGMVMIAYAIGGW